MYANDYAINDGKLQVYFLAPPSDIVKSDAFIIKFGEKILLIDGGIKGTDYTLKKLLSIRSEMLKDHSEKEKEASCKLKISVALSHFHIDHVGSFIDTIVTNEYIAIEDIYLGPETQVDDCFSEQSTSGDKKYRPELMSNLSKLHPDCRITKLPFGTDNRVYFEYNNGSLGPVKITLLPPSADWGINERLEYTQKYYDVDEKPYKMNLYTHNSASVWVHVKYGKNTFLFTADTIKRLPDRNDEALDEMTAAYAGEFAPVTVLKFVHHGIARDNAVDDMLAFKPSYMIFTSPVATAPAVIAEKHPEILAKIPMYCSGKADVLAECYPDTDVSIKQAQ